VVIDSIGEPVRSEEGEEHEDRDRDSLSPSACQEDCDQDGEGCSETNDEFSSPWTGNISHPEHTDGARPPPLRPASDDLG